MSKHGSDHRQLRGAPGVLAAGAAAPVRLLDKAQPLGSVPGAGGSVFFPRA